MPPAEFRPFFVLLLPALILVAVGMIGSTRRLGFWATFIVSILLTPIVGFIAAVLSGPRYPRKGSRGKTGS